MSYSPPNPNNSTPERALGPGLLTGVFSAMFILSLTVAFAPQFFRSLPEATLGGVIGLALVYSIYVWLIRDLRLPFLFHLVIFIFFQWLGLFRTCLELGNFPGGMLQPFLLIRTQPWWFAIMVSGGVVALCFNITLLDLQRLPKKKLPLTRTEIFSENPHLSMGPWEQYWKSWRFSIFGALITTAIVYLVGLGWLSLKHSTFWAGIFFWLQFGLGIWLILIGHYYYRRALWKAVDLNPDPETKRVWGRGMAVWFGLGALISLILPNNWRLDQWWLAQLFLSLFRFFAGDLRISDIPRLPNNPMGNLQTPSDDSNSNMTSFIYQGLRFLFVLPALLLVSILIGGIIHKFFVKEADRLKGLPNALLKLYLFFREWWRKIHRGLGSQRRFGNVGEVAGLEDGKDLAGKLRGGYTFGKGPRAVIRRGYSRLIQSARQNGYSWRQDQTPQEIAQDLNSQLPESEEALTGIVDSYQQARYGPNPPSGGLARLFERLRREVQNRMRFLK